MRALSGRMGVALLLAVLAASATRANQGIRDPFFASIPFERWQSEGKKKQIRWDVDFFPVELSVHQRLLERVRIEVDHDPAMEAAPRRFAVLIEYRDEDGQIWQTHVLADHGRREGDPVPPETVVFGNAFLLPGIYTVSVAVVDVQTLEHSFVRHRIHAKPISGDPLPRMWDGLPEVEFLPPRADPPDEWFLPSVKTRLKLQVEPRRPVQLEVVMNATPGGNTAGSVSALRRNMAVLIPALKVLSQIDPSAGSMRIRVLDLAEHRIAFEQDGGGEQEGENSLDWTRLRAFFLDSRPGLIDARALAGFRQMRNFLWKQTIRRSDRVPAGASRVVVVLSGPAFFPSQEPLADQPELKNGECLLYIRYRPIEFGFRRRQRPGPRPFPARPAAYALPDDELQVDARRLHAQVFDVTSASEFRRVLASIMGQISRM